jgi:hypothetical protein
VEKDALVDTFHKKFAPPFPPDPIVVLTESLDAMRRELAIRHDVLLERLSTIERRLAELEAASLR